MSQHAYYGPSLEKVRDVTMKRKLDRQRQLQLIQEDRAQQKLKDVRAIQHFRKNFYSAKPIQPKDEDTQSQPPLGLGKRHCKSIILLCIQKKNLRFAFFNTTLEIAFYHYN